MLSPHEVYLLNILLTNKWIKMKNKKWIKTQIGSENKLNAVDR